MTDTNTPVGSTDAQPDILFNCIEVRQPIGTFYIGAIDAADLSFISYTDMRRIKQGERRDVEEFSGIQRPLNPSRVAELKQYVTTVDASFPTSVILQVPSKNAEFSEKGVMRLTRDRGIAKIIDGQHRIAGLEGYKGPPFQLNATIFVDMDPEDQALLFATINLKQTKVNKSLAYDLFDFAQTRSPQKTAHNIARLLNSKTDSPLHHKIKLLGTATAGRNETLTQATFVYWVMNYITDNAMDDRDQIKRGNTLPETSEAVQRRLLFRELFRKEQDAEIAKILSNYFGAVAKRWPEAWGEKNPRRILNRAGGFAALMRFFRDAYLSIASPGEIPSKEAFAKIFERIQIKPDRFNPDVYLPGSGGEAKLYQDLLAGAGIRKYA